MIDSPPQVRVTHTPRDRHCLIACDDVHVIAEISYHVLRLGFTVHTTAPDGELVAAVLQRVPALLVVSCAVLAAHGPTLRRDVREATGQWTLAVVVVRVVRHHEPGPADAEVDAVIHGIRPSHVVAATLRRVAERLAAHDALDVAPPIAVRREAREVRVRDRWLRLSDIEFRLLEALLRSPAGLSDAGLEDRVWGARQREGFRGLITVVARLRKKLSPHGVGVDRAHEVAGYRLRW